MNKMLLQKVHIIIVLLFISSCNDTTESDSLIEWNKRASIPNADLRFSADVVVYDNEAYLLPGKGGSRFSSKPEILKFSDNSWTQVSVFDGFAVAGSSKSIINNDIIYILGGVNESNAPTDEVRAYSISDNTFSDENRFTPSSRVSYTETKAYFLDDNIFSSFDFVTNETELLSMIPSEESLASLVLTTENNTIYALYTAIGVNNFFAFNEASNEWTQLADFPGDLRTGAQFVSTNTDVYVGLGTNEAALFDIWQYNIETNVWNMFTEYPGTHFLSGFSFEIDNELFFGGGFTGSGPISSDVLNDEVYSLKLN